MSILGLSQDEFGDLLRQHVRPSNPIDSYEHLVGRSRQRELIEEALTLPGRHIFIYGDRGAGKTSLALTAAHQHNPSSGAPPYVACGSTTTFASIVGDIVTQLIGRSRLTAIESSGQISASALGASANVSSKETERALQLGDLNSVAGLLIEAANRREGRTIVVVDEFENLPDTADRHLFAELVKQLSDRQMPLAFIFCGIGSSLDDLLKGHNSAHRYLQEVPLPTPPLNFSGVWEIVDGAAGAFGLNVDGDSRLRIAQVSDGFPHYVHLICEKLFWLAYRDDDVISELTPDHYILAVRNALMGVEARLRNIYDQAVKKHMDEYQEVLWAIADHFELERNSRTVYSNSYERIMADLGRTPLPYDRFSSHITSLKSARHGAIICSARKGWVRFSENLVRGYVRLKAESQGVRLAMEHEPSPDPKPSWGKSANTGVAPLYSPPRYNFGSGRKR
jgi:hypothetical protein